MLSRLLLSFLGLLKKAHLLRNNIIMPSPRQELLALHKKIYKKNKQLIEAMVVHREKNFAAYERHYLEAVRDYQRVVDVDAMNALLKDVTLIYVGDYHTLNQSQRSLLRMLKVLIKESPQFVLAMEVLQKRHQPFVESYVQGDLDDEVFLKKIGFRKRWFFDLWANFKPIFDFARYHHIPVWGIEADASKAASLEERDQTMAQNILALRQRYPHHKIVVFVGDLHLAPSHLPRYVDVLFKKSRQYEKRLILYQNSESIYWKLAQKGLEDKALFVQIAEDAYCRMHTPPIICQQSYLSWLEHEDDVLDYADARHTFLSYVDQIASFFNLDPGPAKEEVEIFTCGDLSFLNTLKESQTFSAREIRTMKRRISKSQSYFISKKKLVYLASVSVNHAAYEAAHVLRFLCAGEEPARPMQEAFYATVLTEALGFLGSKIINPRRKCLRPQDAKNLMAYLSTQNGVHQRWHEAKIAQLFLEHEKRLKKNQIFHHHTVASFSVDVYWGITQALGYYLGEKMFYGLLGGLLSKELVRQLFLDPLEEEGEAVYWLRRLEELFQKLKLPRKV